MNFVSFVVIVRASRLVKAKNYKNPQRNSLSDDPEPGLHRLQATTTLTDIQLSRHSETSLKFLS